MIFISLFQLSFSQFQIFLLYIFMIILSFWYFVNYFFEAILFCFHLNFLKLFLPFWVSPISNWTDFIIPSIKLLLLILFVFDFYACHISNYFFLCFFYFLRVFLHFLIYFIWFFYIFSFFSSKRINSVLNFCSLILPISSVIFK